ncbi:MAG TPA: glycosyltransferase, partial [Isosphaeraceae bacterium]|nr:glycosyltransferase [Isosphaeraceae bacterium]
MRRIVFVNPSAQVGGGELSLLDLIASLQTARPDLDLHLICSDSGPLCERAEALDVRVQVITMPEAVANLGDSSLRGRGKVGALRTILARGLPALGAFRRYAREIRHALSEVEPDLIHTNGIKAHLIARVAAPKGVPVVWHVRDFLSQRPLASRAARWAARRACGAIAISEAVASDARQVLGSIPVCLVCNAVDIETFRPGPGDGPRLDDLAGLPPLASGTPRVGLVATYARWKGQDLFLEAIRQIGTEFPARYYIIGGPIYQTAGSQFSETELRALAETLGVADRVGFVPF